MVYSQTLYQKEVQIERISISSADSRQMGSLCTLGESVHNQYIISTYWKEGYRAANASDMPGLFRRMQ